jgi:hypothetical protein
MAQNPQVQETASLSLQADGGNLRRTCVSFHQPQRRSRWKSQVLDVAQTGRNRRSNRFQNDLAAWAGRDDLEERATCGVSRSTWCHLNQGRQWTFDFSTDLISSCAVSLRKGGCPNLPALHRMPGGTGLVVWEVVDAQRQV